MNKKNYLIIGGTIIFFLIAIFIISFSNNKKNNDWTVEIKNSQNFEILMKDCNGREKLLQDEILNDLSNGWNTLSDNGPWTGNTDTCYNKVTISYENNGIVKQKEIIIIDNSSVVFNTDTTSTYYTNANNIINSLNSLFIK